MAVRGHDPERPRIRIAQPTAVELMWSWPPRARGVHSSSTHSPADQTLQGALRRLDTPGQGLTAAEADDRLRRHGPNRLHDDDGNHILAAIFRQLRSPMVL